MRFGSTHCSLSILCAATLVSAQAPVRSSSVVVRGIVVDSVAAPIAGVEVLLEGATSTLTNEAGQFRLVATASDAMVVVARRAGFSPDTAVRSAKPGDTLTLRFALRRIATLTPL